MSIKKPAAKRNQHWRQVGMTQMVNHPSANQLEVLIHEARCRTSVACLPHIKKPAAKRKTPVKKSKLLEQEDAEPGLEPLSGAEMSIKKPAANSTRKTPVKRSKRLEPEPDVCSQSQT
jgi:hypothetical protein